jgi:hypothetical protein
VHGLLIEQGDFSDRFLVELPTSSSSRHPAVEQRQKENEGLVEESSDDKNKRIEKLNGKIEELQEQNRYLREQQQEEETFTALGHLQLWDNDVPIKVTVNVKTKSIEWMEIDRERIKKIMRMASYEKTIT